MRSAMIIAAMGVSTAAVVGAGAPGGEPAIVPHPERIELRPGTFRIAADTRILVDPGNDELLKIAQFAQERIYHTAGRKLAIVPVDQPMDPKNSLRLTLIGGGNVAVGDRAYALGDEGYELRITPEAVLLHAAAPAGLFYAVQTLRQLLPPDAEAPQGQPVETLPCLTIVDSPRYRWRGMLLDCCRHFMTKEFVKRYIDLLAYHKLNVFHWHLTDDQGWRIEIKKYPKLTEVGAWRDITRDSERPASAPPTAPTTAAASAPAGKYGGYYTQADMREIVAYAASRYITVVPEIEMPGHSQAAIASYPELSCRGAPLPVGTQWGVIEDVYCAGSDRTFEILQGVLAEVMELFPSKFIHIGGDECPKVRWQACPKCQARIKAEGLKDEAELQSYFVRRIEKFLNSKGRRLVGWDEILEGGLAPNATVQSWRGMQGARAAATSGHDVVSSPTTHCYLDYAQAQVPGEPTNMGFLPLERVYEFEPTPAELSPEQARHVLGLEGNMWTEHAPQSRVDWQVFPRLCAIAEVGWSPKEARQWDDFAARMKTHCRRLDALGIKYFVPSPPAASAPAATTQPPSGR